MTRTPFILISAAFAAAATTFASAAYADDYTTALDARHKECLERIAVDQELALEEAMIWRDQGGARRARHCEAMALFALGHEDEAAFRLDTLADSADGGSEDMRRNFYSEAANFWLAAGEPAKAHESASKGLKLDERHADLRISRARAYAATGRYDYAETDLTSVLAYHPKHPEALRYRADARFQQGKLQDAKLDIEASLNADLTSVESALLRGRINEAIRMKKAEGDDSTEETAPTRRD